MTEPLDDSTLETIVLSTMLAVAQDGWHMGINRADDISRSVAFMHPLAITYTCAIFASTTADSARQLLQDAIRTHRDFALVRELPAEVFHVPLMRQLRISTTAYDWSPVTLRQVLHTMLGGGCITKDEAEWVLAAGPAMLRPDAEWHRVPLFE